LERESDEEVTMKIDSTKFGAILLEPKQVRSVAVHGATRS